VAVDASGDVVAGFGQSGLWRWTLANGWQKLSGADAQGLSVDGTGAVVANFGAEGLWRWMLQGGWQELSTSLADEFAVNLF
jgi:hypothetical protein